MNGTLVVTNFSVEITLGDDDAVDGGGTADACLFGAGVGVAVGVGRAATGGDGAVGVTTAAASFDPFAISILARYRNPATPIATRQTTSTTAGHSQLSPVPGLAADFFDCGVA